MRSFYKALTLLYLLDAYLAGYEVNLVSLQPPKNCQYNYGLCYGEEDRGCIKLRKDFALQKAGVRDSKCGNLARAAEFNQSQWTGFWGRKCASARFGKSNPLRTHIIPGVFNLHWLSCDYLTEGFLVPQLPHGFKCCRNTPVFPNPYLLRGRDPMPTAPALRITSISGPFPLL